MQVDDVVALIGALAVLITALAAILVPLAKGYADARLKKIDAQLAAVHKEVRPNSGSSMKDASGRTEDKIDKLAGQVRDGMLTLAKGQDDLSERVHEVRQDVGRLDQASQDRDRELSRRIDALAHDVEGCPKRGTGPR